MKSKQIMSLTMLYSKARNEFINHQASRKLSYKQNIMLVALLVEFTTVFNNNVEKTILEGVLLRFDLKI